MTGYGAAAAEAPTARVTVEVRSLNQRFLDVRVTAPREFAAFEREVNRRRTTVSKPSRNSVKPRHPTETTRRGREDVWIRLPRLCPLCPLCRSEFHQDTTM